MTALPHVAELNGAPRQRGRQYGEQLRTAIRARDEHWKLYLSRRSPLGPEHFITQHLQHTDYLSAAQRWAPDLLEEVHGIAEGSGLSFEHLFAAQLMDEEWLYLDGGEKPHHCSSMGFAGPHFAAAAQTMDLPCWMNGSQTVLRIRDEAGLESIVLTAAGMIGLCGMNSAGLAVVVNTLSDLPAAANGLPVAFVSRGLLQRRNLHEARQFLMAVPHAAGQNYILADRTGVEDYECCATGKSRVIPTRARGAAVWHTNHPLAGGEAAEHPQIEATGGFANSAARMAALDARFATHGAAENLRDVKAALCSRDDEAYPVSRDFAEQSQHGFTFAGVIWELAPALQAHVAPGPPHATPFGTFGFTSAVTAAA